MLAFVLIFRGEFIEMFDEGIRLEIERIEDRGHAHRLGGREVAPEPEQVVVDLHRHAVFAIRSSARWDRSWWCRGCRSPAGSPRFGGRCRKSARTHPTRREGRCARWTKKNFEDLEDWSPADAPMMVVVCRMLSSIPEARRQSVDQRAEHGRLLAIRIEAGTGLCGGCGRASKLMIEIIEIVSWDVLGVAPGDVGDRGLSMP